MGIVSSLKISFFTFYRLKYPVIILVLSLIYVGVFFHYFIFGNIYNLGEALTRSSFIVQGIILISMFYGVYIVRIEEQNNLNDIYISIKSALLLHYFGRFLFFLLLIIFFCLISIILLWLFFFFSGLSISMLYIQSLVYIVLYWFLSAVIGILIGSLFTLWIKNKAIYPILLVVWLLISPMNYPFIIQLTILLNLKDPIDIINFLNIGQIDPHRKYEPLYGLPLETKNWYKKLFFLVLFLSLLLMSITFKKSKRVRTSYMLITIILCTAFFPIIKGLTNGEQILFTGTEPESASAYDISYYKSYNSNKHTGFSEISIQRYDIHLEINPDLKALVDVTIKNEEENSVKNINFSLYHDLKVSYVKYKGNFINFQQKQDSLIVNLPEMIGPKELLKLTISYQGTSSPYFFANTQAVYLPYNFPWLPSPNLGPAMKMDNFDIYKLSMQARNKVDYNLFLKEDKPYFVNLKKVSPNHWKGSESNGLTIVAGSIERKMLPQGKKVIYPYTWEKTLEDPDIFNDNLEAKIKNISKDLELSRSINIESFLYLPITFGVEPIANSVWINEEQMIISLDDFYSMQSNSLVKYEPLITYGIVPALTWKYDSLSFEDMKYPQLFSNSYAYWYNQNLVEMNRVEKEHSYFNYFIENLELMNKKNNNNETKRIIIISKNLFNFINNNEITEDSKRSSLWNGINK